MINDYGDSIQNVVRDNLEALVEIRDNSIHFVNKDFNLSKRVHEVGTASIKNYMRLRQLWFGLNLSDFDIFLMPLGFVRGISSADAITVSGEEKKLLEYISDAERISEKSPSDEFAFTLNIDVKFNRVSKSKNITEVRITNDENALPVQMIEGDVRDKYPWSYNILTTRLKKRYSDFKQTKEYHKIRKKLEKSSKFCSVRFLDPGNPSSPKKKFYNPNIVREFDEHYTLAKKKTS